MTIIMVDIAGACPRVDCGVASAGAGTRYTRPAIVVPAARVPGFSSDEGITIVALHIE